MSLSTVASQVGVSVATLSRIETNKQNVDVSLLIALTRILGVPPASILGDDDATRNHSTLVRDLAALPVDERAQLFADAAKRTRRGETRDGDIHVRMETLLATVDLLREELLDVRRTVRRRK